MVPRIDVAQAAESNRASQREHGQDSVSPVDNNNEAPQLALPRPLKLRPDNIRSTTEPSPSTLLQSYFAGTPSPSRSGHSSRSSSYSRNHLRSRSANLATGAPVITRAHSMPTVHTTRGMEASSPASSSRSVSPGSSLHSPRRVRSPFRTPSDDITYNAPPRSPSWYDGPGNTAIQSIQEDSELNITPRAQMPISQPSPMHTASFQRSSSLRRRPASPLHSAMTPHSQALSSLPTSHPGSNIEGAAQAYPSSSSGSNSPLLGPQRERFVNESYPGLHHYASNSSFSSIPSTPTSARSRSPSISSLDTIEDAPDLESEAIEGERIERLKLVAERAESEERGEQVSRRSGSLDAPRQQGFGFGRNGGSAARGGERKRWSICGGERRADLDLETIWED